MSLVPAFEIGVWNAWIFMLAWLLFGLAPIVELILKVKYRDINVKGIFRKMSASIPRNTTENKIIYFSVTIIEFFLFIYSVFLPLRLWTAWFYTGLAFFILGLIVFEIISVSWATTPINQPITKGLYRYSRHPIYLASFLQLIGAGIASASWIFLLLVIVHSILTPFVAIVEERFLLEKYGDAYREYMNRTPRWIGIPKSEAK